jgi:hypothetical protein
VVYKAITGNEPHFVNIFVEDEAPWVAMPRNVHSSVIERSLEEIEPLLNLYGKYSSDREWPGPSTKLEDMLLPDPVMNYKIESPEVA